MKTLFLAFLFLSSLSSAWGEDYCNYDSGGNFISGCPSCPATGPADMGYPFDCAVIPTSSTIFYNPINGGWSDYGPCNRTCGGGTKYRYCNNPSPANGGATCPGSNSLSCNTQACPTTTTSTTLPRINGGWSDYGACNRTCGGGTKYRSCNNPAPANGGAPCSGSNSRSCNTQACPTTTTSTTIQYTLTVSQPINGRVAGSGIDCPKAPTTNQQSQPPICSAKFNANTTASVSTYPNTGYEAGQWSGCDTSTSGSCSVTMNKDRNVSVSFRPFPRLNVQYNSQGVVGGPNINCGATAPSSPGGLPQRNVKCTTLLKTGQVVTLTASPHDGLEVKSWTGCTPSVPVSNNTCNVTMNGDQSVSVSYGPKPTLTVVRNLSGIVSGEGISCGGQDGNGTNTTCVKSFNSGKTVTLHATPCKGFKVNWTGCTPSKTPRNTCQVVMDQNKNVSVNYPEQCRTPAPLGDDYEDVNEDFFNKILPGDQSFKTAPKLIEKAGMSLPVLEKMFGEKKAEGRIQLCVACGACATARAGACAITCADGTGWDDPTDNYADCNFKCMLSSLTNFDTQPGGLTCYDAACGLTCGVCAGKAIYKFLLSRKKQAAKLLCDKLTDEYHTEEKGTSCNSLRMPADRYKILINGVRIGVAISKRVAALTICANTNPGSKNWIGHVKRIAELLNSLKNCLIKGGGGKVEDALNSPDLMAQLRQLYQQYQQYQHLFPKDFTWAPF